jgi:hypothetical protein
MSSLTQKPGTKDRIRSLRIWIKDKNPKAPQRRGHWMGRSDVNGRGYPIRTNLQTAFPLLVQTTCSQRNRVTRPRKEVLLPR